jgi:hypothetical protein
MGRACQAKAGALWVAVLSRDIVSVWLEGPVHMPRAAEVCRVPSMLQTNQQMCLQHG